MIRAWLFLIPRVIVRTIPAARFAHSPGNYGRAFVISSTRFQPSKYCPRTEPTLENCGTPTLRFGEALDFVSRSARAILFIGQQRSRS
jgi:hypothetical protein